MSAARSFFQNIDTELLSKQKDCLISLQTTAGFESETGQTLEGFPIFWMPFQMCWRKMKQIRFGMKKHGMKVI